MAHPSKRKGNRFERELVAAFHEAGLKAKRAWGSNGQTLRDHSGRPCGAGTDVLVEDRLKIQAKRRKQIAAYLQPPDDCHVTAVREDRGSTLVVVPLHLFTRLLKAVYNTQTSEV